jgi:hypothetical protein
MISIRQSTAVSSNVSIDEVKAQPDETNSAWLSRVGAKDGVLLLGGASVSHFRIRVAQSHARADLKPSCWSLAGLLMANRTFLSVPLELCGEASEIAQRNAVQTCNMADYDDPERFPSIAVIRFTTDAKKIFDLATLLSGDPETKKPAQRGIIDLPTLMLPWLSYIWIAGKASNPLADGLGLPSAAFIETVYGIAGIELTPGLASATSCPEAIWQAAKYWHEFYKEAAETTLENSAAQQIPTGYYAIRQKAAAADWPPEKKS